MFIKKEIIVLLIVILLTLSISAQAVVQVPQEQPAQKNMFLAPFELLKSPLIWGIILFLVIGIVLAIIIFFVVVKVIKYIKLRNDIFYRLKTERKKLAITHRTYNSKYWWKVEKNIPIRLVKKINNKLKVSNPIAFHRGDYMTHEGNLVIAMNMKGAKHYWFFPKMDLLIIPNKERLEIPQKTKEGKEKNITFDKIPKAEDIVQFNENEILLFAESLSNTGMFYIPVLKSTDGKIIDISMPIYHTLRNVVMGDYLYDQTADFGQIAKKTMDINPYVRSAVKLQDGGNSSVEIPSDK